MSTKPATAEEYLAALPEERRTAISAVRDVVNQHLPEGYVEQLDCGMLSWLVPLGTKPDTKPDTYNGKPLSYLALASQKNHMSLYLMAFGSDSPELAWLRQEYAGRGLKLDMGKSCLRFKQLDDLPLDVVGEAVAKIPVGEFVARYDLSRETR